MPRKSRTENVRKICGCVKWKDCAHPWYVKPEAGAWMICVKSYSGDNAKMFAESLAQEINQGGKFFPGQLALSALGCCARWRGPPAPTSP